jgi:uncharacterized repeat protein (TIGR01451 family)
LVVPPQTSPTDVVIYAGTGEGVYKTTNDAGTWTAKKSGFLSTRIRKLDLTSTGIIYGTSPAGVYKSTDGGTTWATVNSGLTLFFPYPPLAQFEGITVDPTNDNKVYAGNTLGEVFLTDNGGSAWTSVSTGLPGTSILDLAVDAMQSQIIYAGTQGTGIYQTSNGGTSWAAINSGIPAGTEVRSIAIDPTNTTIVYIATDSGVYKSTDKGVTWSAKVVGLTSTDVFDVMVDPVTSTNVFAGTDGGLFRSINSGDSWTPENAGRTEALAIDHANPSIVYAGTFTTGVFKSTDGGDNWSALNDGLPSSPIVETLAYDPDTSTLYGGIFGKGVYEITSLAANIDLAVTKTDDTDPVLAGSNLTYTIQVINNGPGDATGVVLTDTLPAGVTYVSNDSGCTEAAGTVTCNIGDLANTASATVNIVIIPTTAGTITNDVSVAANETDSDGSNNQASEDTVAAGGEADLSVTKTASPDPALVDVDLTYTIVVTNNGPDQADNITLTDTLPGSVAYVSNDSGCTEAAGTVTCDLGSLNNGQSAPVDIVVTPTAEDTITNTADVQSTSEIDSTPANNSVSIDTNVNAPVSGTINKGKIKDKTKAGKDSFKIKMICPDLADALIDIVAETVYLNVGPYNTEIPGSSFTQKGTEPNLKYKAKAGKNKYILYSATNLLKLKGKAIVLDGIDNPIMIQVTIGGWSCVSETDWTLKPKASGNQFKLP